MIIISRFRANVNKYLKFRFTVSAIFYICKQSSAALQKTQIWALMCPGLLKFFNLQQPQLALLIIFDYSPVLAISSAISLSRLYLINDSHCA